MIGAAIICRVADYSFTRISSMTMPTSRRRRYGASILIDAVYGPAARELIAEAIAALG
jgi:hypothetical protein